MRFRVKRKPKQDIAQQQSVQCFRCGIAYSYDPEQKRAPKQEGWKETADGVICTDLVGCRGRVLDIDIGKQLRTQKKGLWLFSKTPRATLIARMDRKPDIWKGPRFIHAWSEDDRVEAAVEYFSWCYPVRLAYAVQIDLDDELLKDRYGNFIPHTHKTLALFLGMQRSNVARAVKRLEERNRVRQDDDGLMYKVPRPELSGEQRAALAAGRPDKDDVVPIGDEVYDGPRIPKKWLPVLTYLLTDIPEGSERACTDTLDAVKKACTDYNTEHAKLRTAQDLTLSNACTALATLLSRPLDLTPTKASPSARPSSSAVPVMSAGAAASPPQPPQSAVQPPHRSVGLPFSGVEEGKGALGKLDRPRPQHQTDRPSGTDNPFTPKIREWLEATFAGIPTSLEDRELDQIAATIHSDQHLEQFQKAAMRQKNPRGWKVFVKIAVECQKHQAKYKAATASGPEESYFERRARELIEDRKKGEDS